MSNNQNRISRNSLDIYGLSQKFSNYNYLINGNFVINQRDKTSYSSSTSKYVYTVDRWRLNKIAKTTCTILNTGIRLSSTIYEKGILFGQILENPAVFSEKYMTFSLKFKNLQGSVSIGIYDGEKTTYCTATGKKDNFISVTKLISQNCTSIICVINKENESEKFSIDLLEAKLEIGISPTPFEPRILGEELALCRYFYRFENQYWDRIIRNNTNRLFIVLPFSMRTTPTLAFDSYYINSYSNSSVSSSYISSGFSFNVEYAYSNCIRIIAEKNNHGVIEGGYCFGSLRLDSEIYD